MTQTESVQEGAPAERGQWNSNLGFILAAVGSAVGLGNIWRFPFVTAENGGAVFILIYLGVLFLLGIPVMWAELAIGRRGRLNVVGSMKSIYQDSIDRPAPRGVRFWTAAGFFFVLFSIYIMSWYAVLSGWVLQYMIGAFTGAYLDDPGAFFDRIVQGPSAIAAHFAVVALTVLVVAFGVQKGIERLVVVAMPVLFLLIAGIAIWAATLAGSAEGYAFLLRPDFGQVTGGTFVAAVGQAFFSLSLGMGAIITYSSYLSKKESLARNGPIIALSDSGVALLGGFMLFPILASFALLVPTVEQGGGAAAVFLAMPAAFGQLSPALATGMTVFFFVMLFVAAYSSALSLLEVSVSYFTDHFGWSRPRTTILLGLIIYTIGIVPALNVNLFTWMAGGFTDLLVILGGLLIVVFAGYIAKGLADELDANSRTRVSRIAMPLMRYVAPPALVFLLLLFLHGFLTDPTTFGMARGTATAVVVALAVATHIGFLVELGVWLKRDADARGANGRKWLLMFLPAWLFTLVGGLAVIGVWRARRGPVLEVSRSGDAPPGTGVPSGAAPGRSGRSIKG